MVRQPIHPFGGVIRSFRSALVRAWPASTGKTSGDNRAWIAALASSRSLMALSESTSVRMHFTATEESRTYFMRQGVRHEARGSQGRRYRQARVWQISLAAPFLLQRERAGQSPDRAACPSWHG